MVNQTARTLRVSLACAVCLASVLAPGATAPGAEGTPEVARPTLAEWLPSVVGTKGAFPRTVVYLTALPADAEEVPEFLGLNAKELSAASYVRTVEPRTAAWDYQLNFEVFSVKPPVTAALLAANADTIVLAPAKGPWKVVRPVNGGDAVETLASAPRPKVTDSATLAGWLLSALGWDGVVLARRGPYLLVGSTVAILATPGAQALAVAGSVDRVSLPPDSRQGAGLLSLTEASGGFGIFDVVFLGQDGAEIPVGAKLIIERPK